MNCVICNKDEIECLDYGTYDRGGVEAMVCTEHQPLSEIGENGSLKHTVNLQLLKNALKLQWAEVDAPEVRV